MPYNPNLRSGVPFKWVTPTTLRIVLKHLPKDVRISGNDVRNLSFYGPKGEWLGYLDMGTDTLHRVAPDREVYCGA